MTSGEAFPAKAWAGGLRQKVLLQGFFILGFDSDEGGITNG
jgi:hypothetical protein